MIQRSTTSVACALWMLAMMACGGRSIHSNSNENQNNNNVSEECGNHLAEGNEICDGTDLRENDCTTIEGDFTGGTLGCSDNCDSWDTTSCTTTTCGNGTREGAELCDQDDLDDNDCTTIGAGFTGGTLACNASCDEWITTDCTDEPFVCGNGVREGPEVCDGTDLGSESCSTYGYAEGVLYCSVLCDGFILTGCYDGAGACGDGIVEWPEQCDGSAVSFSCLDFGLSGGTIGCTNECRLDVSACIGDRCQAEGYYNDGNCDLCELYGGTPDPDCQNLCGVADGTCRSWVDPMTLQSTCVAATGAEDPDCGTCGDGTRDQAEWCDGTDMPGFLDCIHLGFVGGTLACDANCVFETSQCVDALCGDGVVEIGEQCDDGNTNPGDGCGASCMYETVNETEPNDTPVQASTNNLFTPDVAVLGIWSTAGDIDFYAVTVPAGYWLEVQTWDQTGPICMIDTELWVFDTDGVTELAYNDDGASLCAHIDPAIEPSVQNLPGGTYYVQVGNYDAVPGNYLVAILSGN